MSCFTVCHHGCVCVESSDMAVPLYGVCRWLTWAYQNSPSVFCSRGFSPLAEFPVSPLRVCGAVTQETVLEPTQDTVLEPTQLLLKSGGFMFSKPTLQILLLSRLCTCHNILTGLDNNSCPYYAIFPKFQRVLDITFLRWTFNVCVSASDMMHCFPFYYCMPRMIIGGNKACIWQCCHRGGVVI